MRPAAGYEVPHWLEEYIFQLESTFLKEWALSFDNPTPTDVCPFYFFGSTMPADPTITVRVDWSKGIDEGGSPTYTVQIFDGAMNLLATDTTTNEYYDFDWTPSGDQERYVTIRSSNPLDENTSYLWLWAEYDGNWNIAYQDYVDDKNLPIPPTTYTSDAEAIYEPDLTADAQMFTPKVGDETQFGYLLGAGMPFLLELENATFWSPAPDPNATITLSLFLYFNSLLMGVWTMYGVTSKAGGVADGFSMQMESEGALVYYPPGNLLTPNDGSFPAGLHLTALNAKIYLSGLGTNRLKTATVRLTVPGKEDIKLLRINRSGDYVE